MAIDFPNSPSVGQVFTAGGRQWVYTSAGVWAIRLPFGVVAYALVFSLQTFNTGAEVDVTGTSVSWESDASRLYRVSGVIHCSQTAGTAGAAFRSSITDAANTRMATRTGDPASLSSSMSFYASEVLVGTGATITRKLRGLNAAGATFTSFVNSWPTTIVVEDLGVA